MLAEFVEPPRTCNYLPDRAASLECRIMTGVGVAELEGMLVRGWRRQGPLYFRPACGACRECVSIRIPVDRFRPTESQRRAQRRCARFRVVLDRPRVDDERLALYAAWHAARERDRELGPRADGRRGLRHAVRVPAPGGLGAVAARRRPPGRGHPLRHHSPSAWSAIFGFYDPGLARLSPGVATVLMAVQMARERAIPHVYLGYRVLGCPSMRYKAGFRPHELLQGLPAADEAPRWVEAPGS